LREKFDVLDADGNGEVDKAELRGHLQNIGEDLSDAIIDDVMNLVDENGDGKI
jgi:Ca2+-binding EF-hand superfamily protein